jgi:uncharacterized membrane protein YoaK (UPF0700 family)
MEDNQKKYYDIWFVTFTLTIIAGYCDSITFVAAGNIFSAHVTGNFIVFAYNLIKAPDEDAWIKLMTFPIFMVSVMTGGYLSTKFSGRHFLLLCEGVILIIGGVIACFLDDFIEFRVTSTTYLVTMLVVFAMGLQNAFGKLFAKETYGPTTMMTGNVTQFALDIRSFFNSGLQNKDLLSGIRKGLIMIGGFSVGCILGALMGKYAGLVGIILPGMAIVVCYYLLLLKSSATRS